MLSNLPPETLPKDSSCLIGNLFFGKWEENAFLFVFQAILFLIFSCQLAFNNIASATNRKHWILLKTKCCNLGKKKESQFLLRAHPQRYVS